MPQSSHPDIKRTLRENLLSLSPRAFELFAGDLLVYLGMENVSVSRYVGDGGIDAKGDLIAGIFRLPSAIQVKRYRNNIQRPDIDRFIGVLVGKYHQGIFLTTSDFSSTAREKAALSIPRVLTLNGNQITSIMYQHYLGIKVSPQGGWLLDEDYFNDFEIQKNIFSQSLSESRGTNMTGSDIDTVELTPENDLISLRALSYALRLDTTTIRTWLEKGKLQADNYGTSGNQTGYYFRRERIDQIRKQFNLKDLPITLEGWRQEFLDFNKTRSLQHSYKPVLIKAILKLIDRNGMVSIEKLVNEFRAFYVQREAAGLYVELKNPSTMSDAAIKNLILNHPLERFRIKQFIEYNSEEGIVQIAPQLWQELRYHDIITVLESADEQIRYYYSREA